MQIRKIEVFGSFAWKARVNTISLFLTRRWCECDFHKLGNKYRAAFEIYEFPFMWYITSYYSRYLQTEIFSRIWNLRMMSRPTIIFREVCLNNRPCFIRIKWSIVRVFMCVPPRNFLKIYFDIWNRMLVYLFVCAL